ncbi:hypothetical protein Tco_0059794 [Tanacetum coccineum]
MAILMVQPWQKVARQRITQSFSLNSEISFPPLGYEGETEDPMIIEAEIGGHFIHRIYVDEGSASEILKNKGCGAFNLYVDEFCGSKITISVQWDHRKAGVRKIQAVPSTAHEMLKLPAAEERIKAAIHLEYPEQTIAIGSTLIEEGRKALCELLKPNLDIFAWKPEDMTGVPRHLAKHRLNVQEGCLPVRQKKRSQAPERNNAIQDEVGKLVEAGIMKEVHYYNWLSNLVMVKKHDNSWRMYVDFKDLNKSCPKDGYPLPEIDWKVESLCGYPFKCFLDAYKGYHQIKMAKEDEEKTAFITSQGIFCYSKMPLVENCRGKRQHYQTISG